MQRPLTRVAPTTSAPLGVALGTVGLGVTLVAAATGLWPLVLPAAVLFGCGYGCCLASGLTSTERLADPEERGALNATFYAAAYTGFAAPFLVSLVARDAGFGMPMAVLAVLTLLLTVLLLTGPGRAALRERMTPPGALPPAGTRRP